MSVDQNRRPGRYLLTGSAKVLLLSQISESLAGRMELITLFATLSGRIATTAGLVVESREAVDQVTQDSSDRFRTNRPPGWRDSTEP